MNANTRTTGAWPGIVLDRGRRLSAMLARAARTLGSRIVPADPPFHSRMGSWETKVSPAARAAMLALRRRDEPKGPDAIQ